MPHTKTLNEYVTYTPNARVQSKAHQNLLPSNYRIIIHPVFEDHLRPYTYNGTMYITFAATQSNIMEIELDVHDMDIDINKIFLNRKLSRKSNETVTQARKRPKRTVESEDNYSEDTTKSSESAASIETTTTKNEYEFLELTTGFDVDSHDSDENANSDGETLTSTTTESVLDHINTHDDIRKSLHTEILIRNIAVDKKRQKVVIKLGLRLLMGLEYILQVNFYSAMRTSGYGLIYSKYGDERYYLICRQITIRTSKPILVSESSLLR